MEIEPSETELRIAGNVQVLAEVEAEIVSLEEAFSKLKSLVKEKDGLTTAVQSLLTEGTQILSDSASSESIIVKRLLQTRATKDVQAARLAGTEDRLREQTADLATRGANVRRAFQFVVGRLWVARDTRVTEILVDLFAGGWIVLRDGKRLEMRHLARQTKLMKEIRDFDVKVSHPISDAQQEDIALRQRPRLWLVELTDFVNGEPRLVLKVPAVPQPIEQSREMAIA
jgi:hypothetical protein